MRSLTPSKLLKLLVVTEVWELGPYISYWGKALPSATRFQKEQIVFCSATRLVDGQNIPPLSKHQIHIPLQQRDILLLLCVGVFVGACGSANFH